MFTLPAMFGDIGFPFGLIKSIQTGEIVIAANTASNTATISSIVTGNSVVLYGGFYTANISALDAALQYVGLDLTNSTTVTATTGAADASNARTVRYTVIEFNPWAIKRIQNGTISFTNTNSGTASITAVNTANAFVLFQGQNYSPSGGARSNDFNDIQGHLVLTNSTTVTAQTDFESATNTYKVYYTVLEFSPGVVKSIQKVTATIGPSESSHTASISAVTTGNCWTVYNGWTATTFTITGTSTFIPYAVLTNSTTVTFTAGTSSSALIVPCYATVVEFNSQYIKSKQSGQTNIGGSNASNTASISSVNTAKTIVNWLGFIDNTDESSNPGATYAAAALTNATTITLKRGNATTSQVTVSWEALEFA